MKIQAGFRGNLSAKNQAQNQFVQRERELLLLLLWQRLLHQPLLQQLQLLWAMPMAQPVVLHPLIRLLHPLILLRLQQSRFH